MDLRLYDTLTRQKRTFTPIDQSNVRMYVCGPTVYDFAHIGNARPAIVFDVLYRLLRHRYGAEHVTYVRNITDVDDKINDRALRDFPDLPLNDAIRKVTEKTEAQFHADVDALGCLRPTHQPRATDFVLPRADGKTDMVALIGQLIARGHAYVAGGEVLFDTQSMPDYGALSGRRLDDQKAGARIAVDAHKKHPGDFVLWKASSEHEPGWDSPWGRGRPGWHIECSAMSAAYLGTTFDIHGGGLDLIFPHHENEIAQSRCAHGTDAMANTWMHNGFLQVEGEKMSKSTGNFVTIRELLDDWPGDVLRLNMLKTHYRSPIDWTLKGLEESKKTIDLWYDDLKGISNISEVANEVMSPLSDDLNTSAMVSELHAIRKSQKMETLKASLEFLGIYSVSEATRRYNQNAFFDASSFEVANDLIRRADFNKAHANRIVQISSSNLFISDVGIPALDALDLKALKAKIEKSIEIRTAARARKDFAESDRIRDELAAMGVVLKDGKDADGKPITTWEIAR